ncbi:Arrestin domain-containing protein 1 [Labeo rohita]|uniref:Arrestin domain-containing protein 1 n=1 Tax=Labeo rohita TaxID=84645 RepID=A0ABQ8LMM6_LABRO|nr:Arrestin domain-containing protein 1 [Labeo rohita]
MTSDLFTVENLKRLDLSDLSLPIKVNCVGSCGISSKLNDASWMVEEKYLSSTLSVADKGDLLAARLSESAAGTDVLGHSAHLTPRANRDTECLLCWLPGANAVCPLRVLYQVVSTAFRFSFSFQMESTQGVRLNYASVPTSFEGPFGKILYKIRAFIDTPRFSKDYKTQRPFYLLNVLNLNELPDIEQPSCAVTTKKFNYLLVKTGTLMLKACSDLRGYTPGQVIKLSTEIHNKSGKDTGYVMASLIQRVSYKTKRPVFDLRTIAEVEGAGVKAGKHAEWREQIIVPPLPQSGLTSCSLIDIEYFIQVSLKSPEAVVTLPIYIGNIAVNLTPSIPHPIAQGAPMPAMPSFSPAAVVPSAPPAEDNLGELGAGGVDSEEIPTKSHSQQDQSGVPLTMSPSAFGQASGPVVPQAAQSSDGSAPVFCLSTGATIPFFTDGNATPVPTSCPLILPPEYSTWEYPHGESSS